MTVLVTGGTGFIGHALAQSLIADGEKVVTIIRDWTRRPPAGVEAVYGDICDLGLVQRCIADYRVETIYHLASQSIVKACVEDPIGAYMTNVVGPVTILQAARLSGRKITTVVSTSDKAYGHAPAPYDETTAFRPRGVYDASKAAQDDAALMFFHNFDQDVRVVRAVNVYGPGDPNLSRVVPNNVRRLLAGEPPLIHAGAHGMRRQYVYIDDVVDAFKRVERLGRPGEAYCVGSPDEPKTVAEVIQIIAEQFGHHVVLPEIGDRDDRFREIESQWVDDTKVRAQLGWNPQVHLVEGIQRTIAAARVSLPLR